LARIVAAAGHVPDQINVDALRAQLLGCNTLWGVFESTRDYYMVRKKAVRARATIKTLLILLRDETLRKEAAELLPLLEAFYNRIDPKKLDIKAKEFTKNTKGLLRIPGPPLYALVGDWLKQVYDDIFKQPATAWGSHPNTPYTRFVLQVTKELGIECSPHTIDKALTYYRRRGKSTKK
jgi:hypothetical protein